MIFMFVMKYIKHIGIFRMQAHITLDTRTLILIPEEMNQEAIKKQIFGSLMCGIDAIKNKNAELK